MWACWASLDREKLETLVFNPRIPFNLSASPIQGQAEVLQAQAPNWRFRQTWMTRPTRPLGLLQRPFLMRGTSTQRCPWISTMDCLLVWVCFSWKNQLRCRWGKKQWFGHPRGPQWAWWPEDSADHGPRRIWTRTGTPTQKITCEFQSACTVLRR